MWRQIAALTARLSTKELFVSVNCDAGFSEGSIICSFMVKTEDHACYFPPSDKRKRRKIPNLRHWKGFKKYRLWMGSEFSADFDVYEIFTANCSDLIFLFLLWSEI